MKDREPHNPFDATSGRSVTALSPEPPDRNVAELLAGVLDVRVSTGQRVLARAGGLRGLVAATEPELIAAGIHPVKARRLHQALTLARTAIGDRPIRGQHLSGSTDVWAHMRARLADQPVEEFWVIALDVRNRVILDQLLARGSLSGVEIHPRDVFRALIRVGAAAAIFCHNHPSGDPAPSREDIALTVRLRQVSDLCGISVLDHVVVAAEGYVSLANRGWR